jgi:hypothetical protein
VLPPTWFTLLVTLGRAAGDYASVREQLTLTTDAAKNLRAFKDREAALEIELRTKAEQYSHETEEIIASHDWLSNTAFREHELQQLLTATEAIQAERALYQRRLAAGVVGDPERRDRTFAEENLKPLPLPVQGVIFDDVLVFGSQAFFVLTDIHRHQYLIAYDPRLEQLIDGVYDFYRVGDTFDIRARIHRTGRSYTLIDHFYDRHDDDPIAARVAFRQRDERLANRPRLAQNPPMNSDGELARDLFIAFATTVPPVTARIV